MLAFPTMSVPKDVNSANTGWLAADLLPLLTMIPCVPTLKLFYRTQRYTDLAAFGTGFLLAVVYHLCHLDEEGLGAAAMLGLSGPAWRTLDVLAAQWLLARTWAHALGARHALTLGVPNLAFPAMVAVRAVRTQAISLESVAADLGAALAATTALKALLEGTRSLPTYDRATRNKMLVVFAAAFVFFPMPVVLPDYYWLCHSLWHVCLGLAYYMLYEQLEAPANKGAKALAPAAQPFALADKQAGEGLGDGEEEAVTCVLPAAPGLPGHWAAALRLRLRRPRRHTRPGMGLGNLLVPSSGAGGSGDASSGDDDESDPGSSATEASVDADPLQAPAHAATFFGPPFAQPDWRACTGLQHCMAPRRQPPALGSRRWWAWLGRRGGEYGTC